MNMDISIRPAAPGDLSALEALYRAAFPEEDLLALLRALLDAPEDVQNRVAEGEGELVGHVALSACRVAPAGVGVALLGPLAVSPARQRRGIGSRLVAAALEAAGEAGASAVFVLGDPGYYGRFGFQADARVAPPYPIPDDWRSGWQALVLPGSAPPPAGTLEVPAPWRRRALWAP